MPNEPTSPSKREPGKLQYGQQYDPKEGVINKYTQIEENFNVGGQSKYLGDDATEIVPTDSNAAQVKIFDTAATTAALAEIFRVYDAKGNIQFPDVLTNLTVYFNQTSGTGSDVNTGSGISAGDTWSFGLNLPGRANSSISLTADVVPIIRQFWGSNVDVSVYQFFKEGDVSQANVIARLGAEGVSVSAWPSWKPESFTIICFGQQMSLASKVNAQQQSSASDTNTSYTENTGIGKDVETGASTKSVQIPPVLHGTLSLANASRSVTISATASAGWGDGTNPPPFNSSTNTFPDKSVSNTVGPETVTASVQPTTIAATSPPTVPVTGLYLYDYKIQNYQDDNAMILAFVVDMGMFGPSLTALAISTGTLYPSFSPTTLNYTSTTSSSSMTVTPTKQESGATITVNGVAVTSGTASGSISLAVGLNTITIVVTLSPKTATYVLVVTRT